MWRAGLTVEIKLRFQISPAYCGQGLRMCLYLSYRNSLSLARREHLCGWDISQLVLLHDDIGLIPLKTEIF